MRTQAHSEGLECDMKRALVVYCRVPTFGGLEEKKNLPEEKGLGVDKEKISGHIIKINEHFNNI